MGEDGESYAVNAVEYEFDNRTPKNGLKSETTTLLEICVAVFRTRRIKS